MSKVKNATKEGKKKVGGFFAEFKAFALKGNVMSMAVGVLIGSAFGAVVTSLTNNIINPILNCFGKVDEGQVAKLAVTINGQVIQFGTFFADVINFFIMAFVIFMLVKMMNKLGEIGKKEEAAAAPKTKKCPYCKSEIDIEATRCAHCTSEL
jgi:large conductance mechanosensitive channel